MKILSLRWAGQCRASSSSFRTLVLSSTLASFLAAKLGVRNGEQKMWWESYSSPMTYSSYIKSDPSLSRVQGPSIAVYYAISVPRHETCEFDISS